jgi:cell division protein ZapA
MPGTGPGRPAATATMDQPGSRVVTVEINGQRYAIRSELPPEYVVELAAYVDERMRAAARETTAADAVKVAVLAALNIADEYFGCRQATTADSGRLRERAATLERLLDGVLGGPGRVRSGD